MEIWREREYYYYFVLKTNKNEDQEQQGPYSLSILKYVLST